ncbi:hypothetical protein [Kitasatospora sp. NPDC093679]|uniref:hypothetical protein n=1 Tax=Kitasatospora sp. NPDC093679 TaxID=3154983 RepID=UPI00342ABC3F
MAPITGTLATRAALTAATHRCYRLAAAYRACTDPVAKADLFTAVADAACAQLAAFAAHYGRLPAAA